MYQNNKTKNNRLGKELIHLQFCKYGCGTYIGFLNDVRSYNGMKCKPLEVKTGDLHECKNRGWSDFVQCITCGSMICFNNSKRDRLTGRKIRFSSPEKIHTCAKKKYF